MKAISSGCKPHVSVWSTPPAIGTPKVRFQVFGLVPQQRGNAVPALQPQAGKRVCQNAAPPVEIAPGVARERAVRPARDDFDLAENVPRARAAPAPSGENPSSIRAWKQGTPKRIGEILSPKA